MADGAFRVLYCIVGGEKAVFKASVDDDITDLKMCIFQQGINFAGYNVCS